MGGIDYNVQIAKTPYSVEGSADAQYSRQIDRGAQYTTNFLPDGDTYGYDFSHNLSKSFAFNTSHAFKAQTDTWNMQVNPKFSYKKNKNLSSLISGTFTREWDDVDARFLEGIYSNTSSDVLASIVNRNRQNREDFGHTMFANVWSNGKFKHGTDAFTYLVAYTYNRMHSDGDEDYILNFGADSKPADAKRRNYHNHPEYNWRAKASAGYIWNFAKGAYLDMFYTYQRYGSRSVSRLYQDANYLESIGDNVSAMLPSALEANWVPDPANSFDSRYREETHDVNFNFSWNIAPIKTDFNLKTPLSGRRQWLHYMRGDVDARLNRDKFFLGDVTMDIHVNGIPNHWIYIGFDRKVTTPNMVDMVDFTDDLDPLNIRLGNPALKDAASHSFRIYDYWTLNRERQQMLNLGYDVTTYSNSLAYGYSYDRVTGVKTGSMYNINGNLSMGGGLSFSSKVGSSFYFGNDLVFNYNRSADLISTDGEPQKNIVNRYNATEKLNFGYQRGGNRVVAVFNGSWNRYTSHQEGFEPFNALNISYGLQANLKLPANFALNTTFNVYSRRGYSDAALNDDNFVWNARLSYTAMKGNLIFMLDGFDLLHNLKNVSYTVNAQARTEKYMNVMSRYVMLHVQWKFHKMPKTKK